MNLIFELLGLYLLRTAVGIVSWCVEMCFGGRNESAVNAGENDDEQACVEGKGKRAGTTVGMAGEASGKIGKGTSATDRA